MEHVVLLEPRVGTGGETPRIQLGDGGAQRDRTPSGDGIWISALLREEDCLRCLPGGQNASVMHTDVHRRAKGVTFRVGSFPREVADAVWPRCGIFAWA